MILSWPTWAQASSISFVFFAGCALSHGATEPEPPVEREPARSPTSVCEVTGSGPRISVATAPFSSDECPPGPVAGWIDGTLVESDDAVDFILSDCPPHADCDAVRRCQIRIEGSGAPIGAALARHEYDYLEGWAEEGFVRLRRVPDCCAGPGCECGPIHVLYARNGNPDASPPDPIAEVAEELVFRRGDPLCDGGCGALPFALEANLEPAFTHTGPVPLEPIAIAPGETRALGETGLDVHLIASRHDACTDEPATASWVAWLARLATDDGDDVTGPTGP